MKLQRVLLYTAVLSVFLVACGKEESGAPARTAGLAAADPAAEAGTLEDRMAKGSRLYAAHCAACHQADGQGLSSAFPPLAGSDYLVKGSPEAVIDVVLNGLSGPITVNGNEYNSVMPNLSYLSDSDVADIVTFVFNSWGNPGGEVNSADVAAARDRTGVARAAGGPP